MLDTTPAGMHGRMLPLKCMRSILSPDGLYAVSMYVEHIALSDAHGPSSPPGQACLPASQTGLYCHLLVLVLGWLWGLLGILSCSEMFVQEVPLLPLSMLDVPLLVLAPCYSVQMWVLRLLHSELLQPLQACSLLECPLSMLHYHIKTPNNAIFGSCQV